MASIFIVEDDEELALQKALDLGWKDTVPLWRGETVRLVVDFSHLHPGDQAYLCNCHNLEHEDPGVMINIKVQA